MYTGEICLNQALSHYRVVRSTSYSGANMRTTPQRVSVGAFRH